MVEIANAFEPLTKEDKKERRRLKKNPHKGNLRDYPLIDHICNTWEGILVYSLPGIITTWLLFSRMQYGSWRIWVRSTFLNISWLISFIFLIPFIISAFKYWVIWFRSLSKQKDFDSVPRVITKIGVPRQGKSSSSNYECVLIAKKNWTLLKVKYADYLGKIKRGVKLSPDQEKDWLEIKSSYEYCVNSPCIPLLFTIVPVKVGKRYSNKLTYDHLTGRKKLPLHAVVFADEASRLIDAGKSMQQNDNKDWDLSNFFALEGHFGCYVIYLASQDDNIFLDACRCSLYTEIMNKQMPCCKPFWLTALKSVYYWIVAELNRKKPRTCDYFMKRYNFYNKFWKNVGFRKYIVSRRANRSGSNTYYNQVDDGKKLIGNSRNYAIYLPAKLNCTYDDRAFRELAPCDLLDYIQAESWDYLRLKPEDSFLKKTKSKFDIKYEKQLLEQKVKAELKKYKKRKKEKSVEKM